MKYNELYNEVYSDEWTFARWDEVDKDTRAAWKILKVLLGRKGFDHWWHDIDEECQDEIFEEIKAKLKGES